ncbi:2OG-Fe dioxygenase family protein [Streptomyces sp. NPDC014636]|uniref:2OG-Fe dioxygenase family protein n=1 Tax=Streptomyces sp. NPDC014636 TaxID=3364876 RepID=UPI00370149D1
MAVRAFVGAGAAGPATGGEHAPTTTLSEPGDLLPGDDRRTPHSVTPVRPVDPALPAHRHVLVIACTAR